jgi:hypothetical protein
LEKESYLEFSADVFNFTNLLNKKIGVKDTLLDLINCCCWFLADGTTPTFRYNPAAGNNVNQIDDAGLNSSRWQIQTGVRYFN